MRAATAVAMQICGVEGSVMDNEYVMGKCSIATSIGQLEGDCAESGIVGCGFNKRRDYFVHSGNMFVIIGE